MISQNIVWLRKRENLSQEALADRIGVSRQTVAKWESGESVPDVLRCDSIARLFEVSLEDLLHLDLSKDGAPPEGKYIFGVVTVGDKGQIVIPAKARRVFHIKPGDGLMVLGDVNRGIALMHAQPFLEAADMFREEK